MPDDGDADKIVLPYSMLKSCRDSFDAGLAPGADEAPVVDAGLDLAEGGVDKCCLVIRRGPTVQSIRVWPGKAGDMSEAARIADTDCKEAGVRRLYYDAAHTIETEFLRLQPNYQLIPVLFGSEVMKPDKNGLACMPG